MRVGPADRWSGVRANGERVTKLKHLARVDGARQIIPLQDGRTWAQEQPRTSQGRLAWLRAVDRL